MGIMLNSCQHYKSEITLWPAGTTAVQRGQPGAGHFSESLFSHHSIHGILGESCPQLSDLKPAAISLKGQFNSWPIVKKSTHFKAK